MGPLNVAGAPRVKSGPKVPLDARVSFMVPNCFISKQSTQGALRANGSPLGTIRPLKLPGAQDQESMEQIAIRRSRSRALGVS